MGKHEHVSFSCSLFQNDLWNHESHKDLGKLGTLKPIDIEMVGNKLLASLQLVLAIWS